MRCITGVSVGMIGGNAAFQGIHPGLRFGEGYSRLQLAQNVDVTMFVVVRHSGKRHGHPQLGSRGIVELGWHHPNDRVWLGIECEGMPEYVRVAIECGAPELVAHYDDICLGLGFCLGEGAAYAWRNPEDPEIVWQQRVAEYQLRIASSCERDLVVIGTGDILENVILLLPLREIPGGNREL